MKKFLWWYFFHHFVTLRALYIHPLFFFPDVFFFFFFFSSPSYTSPSLYSFSGSSGQSSSSSSSSFFFSLSRLGLFFGVSLSFPLLLSFFPLHVLLLLFSSFDFQLFFLRSQFLLRFHLFDCFLRIDGTKRVLFARTLFDFYQLEIQSWTEFF